MEGIRYFSMLEWADPTTHLLYWVDVHVTISEDTPPTADTAHAPNEEDETDLVVYENIKPQLIARLLTPVATTPPSNNPSISKFARIRRTAIDSNGNCYPDWYEYATFGPDSVFAMEGSEDYVDGSLDSDGDGFTNAEEIAAKTDPNSATSHPPETTYLAVATKSINFDGSGLGFGSLWMWGLGNMGTSLSHAITKENNWQPPFTKSTLGPGFPSASAMEAALTGLLFPDSPDKMPVKTEAEKAAVTGIKLVGGYHKTNSSTLAASGSAAQARYWLVHKPKSPDAVTRYYLLKTTNSNLTNQADPEITYAVKTLTVAPNQTISNPTPPDELAALPSTVDPATGDTTATVSIIRELLPIEFVTPAGDPVNAPVEAGTTPANIPDGANEFTFSIATSGVLTLKLKAKVPGIGYMPSTEQEKFTFSVDTIGGSTFAWNAANPGGKVTVSGDFIEATATYTGLPENNSDFGVKKATLKYGTSTAGEAKFEVSFPRNAANHPGPGAGTDPNWFFYWAQVAGKEHLEYGGEGVGDPAEAVGMRQWSWVLPRDKKKIILYSSLLGKFKSYSPLGELYSGIDRFVGTVIHERHHVFQIEEADKLVPTGTAGTPWRYGWSFGKLLHNHYAVGIDGKPGRPQDDDDKDGTEDNFLVDDPGELGKGGAPGGNPADDFLGISEEKDWPAAWPVPADGPLHPAIERAAVHKSNDENEEDQNARLDWGNPGKNHKTINNWDD